MMAFSKMHWLVMATICAAVAGCDDKGSLGEYPETEGGSDDGATSTTGSDGGDGMSGTSAADSGSADSGDGPGDSGDTGSALLCNGEEGNCQQFAIDCSQPDACGGLDSVFDDEGCLRQFCSPGECGDGERCYRPESFGGCMGSGVFCEDDFDLQMCICGGPADCGGAYCVPESIYPTPDAPPPGAAVATNGCAPNDAPTIEVIFGVSSDACDVFGPDPGAASLVMSLVTDDLVPGMYEIGNYAATPHLAYYDDGNGNVDNAWSALLVIEANDANGLDGWWEFSGSPDGGVFFGGTFVDLPFCPQDVLCG